MFFGNIDVRWRVWWSAVEVGLAAFLSAMSLHSGMAWRSDQWRAMVRAPPALTAPSQLEDKDDETGKTSRSRWPNL